MCSFQDFSGPSRLIPHGAPGDFGPGKTGPSGHVFGTCVAEWDERQARAARNHPLGGHQLTPLKRRDFMGQVVGVLPVDPFIGSKYVLKSPLRYKP